MKWCRVGRAERDPPGPEVASRWVSLRSTHPTRRSPPSHRPRDSSDIWSYTGSSSCPICLRRPGPRTRPAAMPISFPCPNPACTQVFSPQDVRGVTSLTCPKCGSVFQFGARRPAGPKIPLNPPRPRLCRRGPGRCRHRSPPLCRWLNRWLTNRRPRCSSPPGRNRAHPAAVPYRPRAEVEARRRAGNGSRWASWWRSSSA